MQNKVLVVDGDTRSLRLLEVSLKEAGYSVGTATSGQDALAQLEVQVPDLVLANTELGEVDSFALYQRMQQRPEWAHLPFLFILNGDNPAERLRAVQLGASDFLTRPIFLKEALSRVELLLEKHAQRGESGVGQPTGRGRFAGSLSGAAILDLLQTMELGRKAGTATCVSGRGQRAVLYFVDGAVVDAELGNLRGEEALYRVLTFHSGEYRVELMAVDRPQRITTGTTSLLVEAMRRLEEWNRLAAALPPLTTALSAVPLGGAAGALTPESLPQTLREVLQSFDGQRSVLDVLDLLDEAAAPPHDALLRLSAVAKLYAARLLTPAGRPISGEPRSRVPTPIAIPRLVPAGARLTPPPLPSSVMMPRLTPPPIAWPTMAANVARPTPAPLPRMISLAPSALVSATDENLTPLPPPSPFARAAMSAEVSPMSISVESVARLTPPPVPAAARLTPPPVPAGARLTPPPRLDSDSPDPEQSSPGHNLSRLAQRLAATRQPLPFTPPPIPGASASFSLISQSELMPVSANSTGSQPMISSGMSWTGEAPQLEPISIPDFELTVEHSAPSWMPEDADAGAAVHLSAPARLPAETASTTLLPIEVDEVVSPFAKPATPPPLPAPSRRVGQAVTWAVAGAALFGLGVGLYWLRQDQDGEHGRPTASRPPVSPSTEATVAPPPASIKEAPPPASIKEAPPPSAEPSLPVAPAGASAKASPLPAPEPTAAPPPVAAEPPPPAAATAATAVAPPPADAAFSALIAKARTAEQRGNLQAAYHAVRTAQHLQPHRAEVFAVLAQLSLDEGNADHAATVARRALLSDPGNADAYLVLGTVEQARAHAAKAHLYFKKYLTLAPNGDRAADVRAVLRMGH